MTGLLSVGGGVLPVTPRGDMANPHTNDVAARTHVLHDDHYAMMQLSLHQRGVTHAHAADGLTVDSDSQAAGIVTVWVSAGTAGADATLACRITTDNAPARTDERTAIIRVRQR